jgi:uncharacterized protein
MDSAGGHFHVFESAPGQRHLLVARGSMVYDADEQVVRSLSTARQEGEAAVTRLLSSLAPGSDTIDFGAPKRVATRALSLAVAQSCNLGCQYCYAEQGGFGGKTKAMSAEVAQDAARRLIEGAERDERVHLAFMGGEPLLNRAVIHETSEFAARLAGEKGITVGFSLTTNGTLLDDADAEFFDRHGFAVTISLDGVREAHDRLRPAKSGRGTYQTIVTKAARLLQSRRRCKVYARATVTPANLSLRETLDGLVALGFDGVGFAPLLHAPTRRGELQPADFSLLLAQMIACGREFERRLELGEHYPFSNMITALEEVHRGTHRPYPCGAGAGYLGVDADGGLFACHRFVGDERFRMGDVGRGVDDPSQEQWLATRAVDGQEPCRTCWARYLCGGGCHYDVIHRGRAACTYIRGWLDYVLGAYVRIANSRAGLALHTPSLAGEQRG